jgi:hypothetical protein
MESNKDKKRHCLQCLLREMDKGAYMDNLYSYIKRLDEDIKTDKALYEERLSVCKGCNYLSDGMCGACGCFVELRAAIKNNSCSYNKW